MAVGEINNHLSILEGLLRNERADVQKQVDEAYQRGLDAAWEAAKKIAQQWENDTDTEHRVVIDDSIRVTLDSMTASEAIEKLKAYEEKQKANDKIKVGDEVIAYGHRGVVTYVNENLYLYTVMMHDGSCGDLEKGDLKKTGKKHDIDKILEEMKE